LILLLGVPLASLAYPLGQSKRPEVINGGTHLFVANLRLGPLPRRLNGPQSRREIRFPTAREPIGLGTPLLRVAVCCLYKPSE
jgi:hypothetical protein